MSKFKTFNWFKNNVRIPSIEIIAEDYFKITAIIVIIFSVVGSVPYTIIHIFFSLEILLRIREQVNYYY